MKSEREVYFQGKPVSRFEFRGSGSALLVRHLKNVIFTVLTLGFYYFWARVEMRKTIWSNIFIAKSNLEYKGTGLELLIGSAKLLSLLIVLVIGCAIMMRFLVPPVSSIQEFVDMAYVLFLAACVAFILFFAPFGAFAAYSARRFILSRTEYAGVRFSLSADAKDYALLFFKHSFITLVTLGLHYPVLSNETYSFKTNRTFYGNQRFQYTASHAPLSSTFLWCWILFLPTFGLSFYWYKAREKSYHASNTRLGEVSFISQFLGHELMLYEVGSKIAMALSLGLLAPWIITAKFRYHVGSYALVGQVPKISPLQFSQKPSAISDKFADVIGSNVI